MILEPIKTYDMYNICMCYMMYDDVSYMYVDIDNTYK